VTHGACSDALLGAVEESAVTALSTALEEDLQDAPQVLTLLEAMGKVKNVALPAEVVAAEAEALPKLLEGVMAQCQSGQVSSEVIKPWADVIALLMKDEALAGELKTPAVELKASLTNLMSFVKLLVHTRQTTKEFSDFRAQHEVSACQRTLLVLQAAVVKLQSCYETDVCGPVTQADAQACFTKLKTLARIIVEGSPPDAQHKITGLHQILNAAGLEVYDRLFNTLSEQLVKLEQVMGGKSELGSWFDGLGPKASWEDVLARAKETVLKLTKETNTVTNTCLAAATTAPRGTEEGSLLLLQVDSVSARLATPVAL
jgi:hypothetical protein